MGKIVPGSKALTARKLILLVLGVATLFMAFVVFAGIDKVSAYINDNIFSGLFGIRVAPKELVNALECSYYRCVEGCGSDKIAGLEINGPDGTLNCNENFCDNVPADTTNAEYGFKVNNKVCGWGAQQYPVEVEGMNTEELPKRFGSITFDCVLPSRQEDVGVNILDLMWRSAFVMTGTASGNWLVLDSSVASPTSTNVYGTCNGFYPGKDYKSMNDYKMQANGLTMYISTDSITGPFTDRKFTTITSDGSPNPPHPIVAKSGTEYYITTNPDLEWYRLKVSSVDPPAEYLIKITSYPARQAVTLTIPGYTTGVQLSATSSYYLSMRGDRLYFTVISIAGDGTAKIGVTHSSSQSTPRTPGPF